MLTFYCSSLLLFGLLGLSLSANPGVKVRATQKWLDYIQTVGMDVLRQMLQDEPLPDIIGSTRMFGAVEYSITGIRVDTFEFRNTLAIPIVGTDVDVTIVDASAKAHGNWKVHHWLIKDKGGFTLSLSGVRITATLTTFQDRYNCPSVYLSKCHSHVEGGSIKFSGSMSWLYNLFSVFLEKPICNNLSQKLCPRVADGITVLQKELSTFRVQAQIDARAEAEYYLVMPPAVAKQHIDLSLKGIVHPVGNPVESPFPIHIIQLPSNNDSMLLIGLSEFFFNSVGFTYFTTDALKLTITNKEFPRALWLKTSDYNEEIPEMTFYYPESRPVMMRVSATKVPVISLTPGLFHLEFSGFLAAFAVLPDSSTKPIFSLKLGVNLSTSDLRVSDFNLTGSFHLKRYQISSVTSNVGVISDSALQEPVHYMLTSILMPTLNVGLMNGVPIPSLANISLTETEVKIDQGSVLILTDMFYIPWRKSLSGQPLNVWTAE